MENTNTKLDSRVLIKLLKELSSEVTANTLPYLLLSKESVVKSLTYGNNNTKKSAWVNPRNWYADAIENFRYAQIYTEAEYKTNGIHTLLSCRPRTVEDITTLEERFALLLETIFYEQYDENLDYILPKIVSILEELDVSKKEIEFIQSQTDFKQIASFLSNRAKNRGKSLAKPKAKVINDKPNTNYTENKKTVSEQDPLIFRTYNDLKSIGLSSLDIIKQLLANDAALYGNIGHHAGTSDQWATLLQAQPENWGFLCKGTKIIGNFSFTFLSKVQETELLNGTLLGTEINTHNVENAIGNRNELAIHILNISLNDGYQSLDNWNTLWKQLGNTLQSFTEKGLFVRTIYAILFLSEHENIFNFLGFKSLETNQPMEKGKLFGLNLVSDSLENFSWIMPEPKATENQIVFRQLSRDMSLNNQNLLEDIATLIFDTDQYIYKAMMSRSQAKNLLPLLFAANDPMFTLDNIFCAIDNSTQRVVGILLHKKGPLHWSANQLKNLAFYLDESLPDTIDMVETEYFSKYSDISNDTSAIINCCIHFNWRNSDIGTRMLSQFCSLHNERLRLYVLNETRDSLKLYLSCGFQIVSACNGFSVDHRKLPCLIMERPPVN